MFTPIDSQISENDKVQILEIHVIPDLYPVFIRPATVREVTLVIKVLNSRKAPGYDGVSGKVIKEPPLKAIRLLTILFNACFRLMYFTLQWKIVNIKIILKPGKDHNFVLSCRPIILLPILTKLCEKLLCDRLSAHFYHNKLTSNLQFSFRNKHSTI